MKVLVTGGAGYIGSHTVIQLLTDGHDVVVMDNFVNSSPRVLERIGEVAGRAPALVEGDVAVAAHVERAFAGHDIDEVIHFAGLKAVGDSVAEPVRYYTNNVLATLTLVRVMDAHDVRRLVFSSSATVYGARPVVPTPETEPRSATNPYGWTKVMGEQILEDVAATDPRWRIALLRYFNPVGAHPSGRLGEDPRGVPSNILPFICQVAVGREPVLRIHGDDYDTPDGTGVRDFIHVEDLAAGHLAAMRHLQHSTDRVRAYNLGTGQGTSVRQLVDAFEAASGRLIDVQAGPRRPGDVATSFADPSRAHRELGWHAVRTIETVCIDAWRWQSRNPAGYDS